MPRFSKDADATKDVVERPRYSVREASRILQLPTPAAALLLPGGLGSPARFYKVYLAEVPSKPYRRSPQEVRSELQSTFDWAGKNHLHVSISFRTLAAWFVLRDVADAVFNHLACTGPSMRYEDCTAAFDALSNSAWDAELFGGDPQTHAEPLLARLADWLGEEAAQTATWTQLAKRLEAVERRNGRPQRLQFSGVAGGPKLRAVWIDPERRFGQPIVFPGTIPTLIIHDRFLAGDSIIDLADDYGMEAAAVEEAVRYEAGCDAAAGGRFFEEEE